MVEAKLNYLAPMDERPFYYQYPPADGQWRNTHGDVRKLPIGDARDLENAPTLDREGFELVHLESAVEDLFDGAAVEATYYGEVQELVEQHSGARRVVAFDFNLRRGLEDPKGGIQAPVRFVHTSPAGAPARQSIEVRTLAFF